MKSLRESILSTNNANVKYLYSKDIKNIYSQSTPHDVFNMRKMYDDVKKITGHWPKTHAEAVKKLLFKDGKMTIPSKEYDKLLSPNTKYSERNGIFSDIAKEKLKDYMTINPVRVSIYFKASPWFKGQYTIGVFAMTKDLPNYDLFDIEP